MPELPEVRTVSKHLNNRIKNLIVSDVIITLDKIIKDISPSDFKNKILGEKIISVSNEGKWIVIHLTNEQNIIVHLRLEGKFRTQSDPNIKTEHDHITLVFNDGTKLYFNDTRQFGTFHLRGSNYRLVPPISNLGMDFNCIKPEWLHEKLSRKKIPIKSSLLDQTLVVGLGNIYVNEVLWFCQINPNKPSNEINLKQVKQIIHFSHKILEEAYLDGGSSIQTYSSLDGLKGTYQEKLEVHMREGSLCSRCKSHIIKTKVNGRGTYWCPFCQK